MDSTIKKEKRLPPQGSRTPSGRQGAVAVPGSSLSSSYDGLSTVCPAGAVEELVPAKTPKTGSEVKRSGTKKGEKPIGSSLDVVREDESPDDISVSLDREAEIAQKWDDIGDSEEMYLANEYEELYELVMKETTFKCKVGEKSFRKFLELFRSLLLYSREYIEELQRMMDSREEIMNEGSLSMEETVLLAETRETVSHISFQHRRIDWMVEELSKRSRDTRKELRSSELRANGLAAENEQLWEKIEALTRERDELLDKVNSRKGEKKETSIPMDIEVPDVDTVKEHTLSAPQGIPQSLEGALVRLIETKMEEILSRAGLSAEREGDDLGRPINTGKALGRNGPGNGATERAKGNKLWSEVVAKSGRKPPQQRNPVPASGGKKSRKRTRKKREWPKLPQTAAVVLTAPVGKESSCAELLRCARQSVSIEEMEIPHLEIRRAKSGGYILGVPGPSPETKADRLASSLMQLAGDAGVKVTRPTKRADIRVSGLNESTTPEEVVMAISKLTGCPADAIRGRTIKRFASGLGSMWLQGPVEMAVKAANTGRIKVGWASASVEMLKARPLRCYRCLEIGHIGVQCTSKVVRAQRCFRCGVTGHRAGNCKEEVPQCPLCMDTGRPSNHVLGGPGCDIPFPPRNSKGESKASEAVR